MSKMYFAKFNLNSNIYEVYQDNDIRLKILNKIIANVNQERTLVLPNGTEYKFCNLEKNADEMYIAARIIKIFKGEVERYNRKEDSTNSQQEEDLAKSITFYFDVLHEEIAFTTKQGFSQKEFLEAFKLLIEMFVENLEFEIILEQNSRYFEKRVNEIPKVIKARLILIPPNDPNYKEFQKIYGRSFDEVEETKSTQYIQEVRVSKKNEDGLKTNTQFFKKSYYAIGKGYAKMVVTDADDNDISSENSAYTETIKTEKKDIMSEVKETAKRYITKLLKLKSELVLDEPKEDSKPKEGENATTKN